MLLIAPTARGAITITTDLPGYYTLGSTIQGIVFQETGAQSQVGVVWTISAGALPPGLDLTQRGVFSGTPNKAGTYQFTVKAAAPQEPNNTPGTKSFTIGVPQIVTASPLPPATVGVPYSVQLQYTDGPAAGALWSVTLGGLPIGLTIDPRTGIYSGTPTRTGTFNPSIMVGFGVASAVKLFSITISAASQTLTVAPSALQFNAAVGDISGPQNLTVSSGAASSQVFSVLVDDGKGGPAPAWLKVTPTGGSTPGILKVSLVPQVLATGVYAARIRVGLAAVAAQLPPIDVPVTLTVTNPPPNLTLSPLILRFRARTPNPGIQQQTFILRNTGGGTGPIPFTLAVTGKSPWIVAVDASAPNVHVLNPTEITVTISTQGLGLGSYRDTILIKTPLDPPFDQFEIPVSLVVAGAGSIMGVEVSGLRFATTQGNQGSRTVQVVVRNLGDPGSAVNWTAQAVRGADVVTIVNERGTSVPGNPSSFGVRLSPTAASAPGGKFALIQVSDPQSQNAPQFVVVVADVAPAGTAPVPDPDPAGVAFVAPAGGAAPAPQQVNVNTTSASAVAFFTSVSTDDGANWLSAKPASNTTSQGNPAQVAISVNPAALRPGIYTGTVNIGIGPIVRGVTVTLIVQAPGAVASMEGLPAVGHAAACAPTSAVLAQTGIFDNFSVPAGWPATLAVQASDNCGNPLTNASVVASFSNGDSPVSLTGDSQSGSYTATWQPGTAATSITVTVDATSGTLAPAEMQVAGSVTPNTATSPSLATGGFLNNLNPQVGAALAPGTVTQVYGDNIADAPDQPSAVPLPPAFKGVEVLVGGLNSPLFYVSKNQLVIQLPSELAPNHTYSALLVANNQISLPQEVDVVPVTPGTVAFADGRLVAQHGDYSLVDTDHPARPNEPLTVYLVGMGATNPPVRSGSPAPSDPLAKAQSHAQVSVDGQPAEVSYDGLTPGGVGLYQINFTVPAAARSGSLDVVITQDNVKANATKLIVAQ